MAATRFYIASYGTPTFSPAFDAGWEQTGQALRRFVKYKPIIETTVAQGNSLNYTVPITTTQDILGFQGITDPIPPQRLTGTFSLVVRVSESATTANVTLAVVVKVISQDGSAIRGTLFSVFGTDSEFAVPASAATRIVNAVTITPLTTQPGDRICVELGGTATAPTAATTFLFRQGSAAATDFALTTALTTDLNPWFEFSQDLYNVDNNNYKSVKAGDGMSVSEKIR